MTESTPESYSRPEDFRRAFDGLEAELLDPDWHPEEGLRSVGVKLREFSERLPFRSRMRFEQAAGALGKARVCHDFEQSEDFEAEPTWSILWCLDCENRGVHFAPAAARALYELERDGNSAVDTVLAWKKDRFAEEGKPKALAWTELVEKHLADLRDATSATVC